jgi:hypothetical protein
MKQHSNEFTEPVATLIQQEPDEMDLETFLADIAILEKLLKIKKEK